MDRFFIFVLLLLLCHNVYSLNILAIASLPLKSHYGAFGPLFRELASRGHSVTVINNFPDEIPLRNLSFIDLKSVSRANTFPTLQFYEDWQPFTSRIWNVYRHVGVTEDIIGLDCEDILTNKEVKDSFANVKYDVVFVEQFMSDCGLVVAGALTDAPIIGVTSHVLLPWAYARLGLPFDVASDAFYFSDSGPNPSLSGKLETFIVKGIFNTIGKWFIQRSIHKIFQRHLPQYDLDIEKIARDRMKMMFSYQHFSLTGARTLSPQILEIGGLHVGKPNPVPEDIEAFLNAAKYGAVYGFGSNLRLIASYSQNRRMCINNSYIEMSNFIQDIETFLNAAEYGAVYVGFGSNLRSSTMSEEKLKEFLEAFKKIRPLKVLFKWENGTLNDENVLTRSWFPQLDVLCHPKVIGFVSHGGMLGTSEAAACGVPMVAVPFFGDQFGNAAAVRASGLGTTLYFNHLNGETLAAAIKTVTSETSRRRAKEISTLWNERPMSAMESAIYWTEYVARHPNAPPSLPSKNTSWFESLLLDVYGVIISLFIFLLLIVYFFCKMFKFLFVGVFRLAVSSNKSKDD